VRRSSGGWLSSVSRHESRLHARLIAVVLMVTVFGLAFVLAGIATLADFRGFGTRVVTPPRWMRRGVPSRGLRVLTGSGYLILGALLLAVIAVTAF
jgi:hypothetical protein